MSEGSWGGGPLEGDLLKRALLGVAGTASRTPRAYPGGDQIAESMAWLAAHYVNRPRSCGYGSEPGRCSGDDNLGS